MEIVKPSFRLVSEIDGDELLLELDSAARVCYKSEDKLTYDNLGNVINLCINSGHDSVLEHVKLSFNVILDNGILREWTRHRIASYSVESTRYCDYSKNGSIKFIAPLEFEEGSPAYEVWRDSCEYSEKSYNKLWELGCQPQERREVLNFSVACEMRFTANIRSLRNLLTLRCAKEAHLHMRELCIPMLLYLQDTIPIVFDDIKYDETFVEKYLDGDKKNYVKYLNKFPIIDSYRDIIDVQKHKREIIKHYSDFSIDNLVMKKLIDTRHTEFFTSDDDVVATSSVVLRSDATFDLALYLKVNDMTKIASVSIGNVSSIGYQINGIKQIFKDNAGDDYDEEMLESIIYGLYEKTPKE